MHHLWKLLLPAVLLSACMAFVKKDEASGAAGTVSSEKLRFRVDTLLTGLEVPWGMTFLPNGDMLFTERDGELRLVRGGKLHPDPIGGVPEVRAKGQGGLLDIELHPNYAQNGWIYLSYASPAQPGEEGDGSNTALMRAKLNGHQLTEQQVIFKARPNYSAAHHYGGRIEFDREGYVYLSLGDRGGTFDNQTLANHRGKVVRLRDDGSIPEDNPFFAREGAMKEVFSWGHRNPQGMALNPATGELWEHEHGPQGGDEVNIVRKGNNYGWAAITFGIDYDGSVISSDTARQGMEQPVLYWVPSIAPCGMDFVTSDTYAPWKGNLLVGSMKFRYLKRLEISGDKVTHQETLIDGIGRIRAVEEAPDGYIYLAVEGPGMIVRLVPVN
jgi:glucose/arabinose dehydrogenase